MSPNGEFLKVSLETPSGSISFDDIAKAAAEEGTWDKNPPERALASDGNIHFVFQTRTWVRFVGDKATERRWLILAVSYTHLTLPTICSV